MIFTQMELAAIALINEVEANIRLGVPITSALINAADNFRKVQLAQTNRIGADLDAMYKRVQQQEATVVRIKPQLKVIDGGNDDKNNKND
jgi:hypothetical protein